MIAPLGIFAIANPDLRISFASSTNQATIGSSKISMILNILPINAYALKKYMCLKKSQKTKNDFYNVLHSNRYKNKDG